MFSPTFEGEHCLRYWKGCDSSFNLCWQKDELLGRDIVLLNHHGWVSDGDLLLVQRSKNLAWPLLISSTKSPGVAVYIRYHLKWNTDREGIQKLLYRHATNGTWHKSMCCLLKQVTWVSIKGFLKGKESWLMHHRMSLSSVSEAAINRTPKRDLNIIHL